MKMERGEEDAKDRRTGSRSQSRKRKTHSRVERRLLRPLKWVVADDDRCQGSAAAFAMDADGAFAEVTADHQISGSCGPHGRCEHCGTCRKILVGLRQCRHRHHCYVVKELSP